MQNGNSRENGAASQGVARQVLSFALGQEVYGVDILRLKEIRGWSPVTRIPQSPPWMLGVLNLRGSVVPVFDLRLRFGLQLAEFTAVTVVIVLSLDGASGQRECGIVVDKVLDVVDFSSDRIRPAPTAPGSAASGFIEGIAMLDGQMLILLDAERLVFGEQSSADKAA